MGSTVSEIIAAADGTDVHGTFMVRSVSAGKTSAGKPYVRLLLGDATGQIQTVFWNHECAYTPSQLVSVSGVKGVYNSEPQMALASAEVEPLRTGLMEQMYPEMPQERYLKVVAQLTDLFSLLPQDSPYTAIVNSVFTSNMEHRGASNLYHHFRMAPAAEWVHHAVRGGLAQHSVMVAQHALNAANDMNKLGGVTVDTSLVIAGALIHDIGKLFEYRIVVDPSSPYAPELCGHIALGCSILREVSPASAHRDLLEHIILSHHGKRELGSPVEPMTIEAVLVSAADMLDARSDMISAGLASTPVGSMSAKIPLINSPFLRHE